MDIEEIHYYLTLEKGKDQIMSLQKLIQKSSGMKKNPSGYIYIGKHINL